MVALYEDGSIRSRGPIDEGLLSDDELEEDSKTVPDQKADADMSAANKLEEKKPAAKLVQAEEKGEGRISRRALISFFRSVSRIPPRLQLMRL